MKLSQLVFLAIFQTAIVVAQVNVPSAADIAECGDLGVLRYNLTDLPEGVDPKSVRKCANPPGSKITPEIAARDGAPSTNIMGKRDCWYGSAVGCSEDKLCFKSCGPNGQWCWAALDGGWGPYIGCNSFNDCNADMACAQGDCDKCGCSC